VAPAAALGGLAPPHGCRGGSRTAHCLSTDRATHAKQGIMDSKRRPPHRESGVLNR